MHRNCYRALAMLVCLSIPEITLGQNSDSLGSIGDALTFWASFDKGTDADFAKGDKRIYTASSAERKDSKPGLHAGETEIARGRGRRGGNALRFIKKSGKDVFYKVAGNLDYRAENWNGTVSFWLQLDPQVDLGDWYCDPIQITEKAWNDAAIWVDFTKDERPKHFRLGVLADLKVWNPMNRDFDKMTPPEQPAFVITRPPFSRGKWTHVAIAFENFNTGKNNGVARLYLDGKLQGSVSGKNQVYHWDPEKAAIQLGLGYVGLYDDLTLFNRVLTDGEIQRLSTLELRDVIKK